MPHHLIARDGLGTLTKLGQGGQGIVYQVPKAKTRFADKMVYKEYKPQAREHVSFEALSAMPTLVEDTLSYQDGQGLVSIAAWPCALIETDTGPVGFVMPAITDSFYIHLTTVKGVSRTTAEFQHLLNPPSVLAARGIAITDVQRYELVREVARALAFLHRIGVCVGDISPKNLLFSMKPHPAVYFIDCDAMRVDGVSALPQVETPEWEVPTGEEPATIESDTYKLGLLALRLLTGDQHTKNPQQLPPTTPKPLHQLITDTLTNKPGQRPLPEAWTYLLGHVIEQAENRAATTQTLTRPKPAPTHAPEPQPVVKSRPTATPPAGAPVAVGASAPSTPGPLDDIVLWVRARPLPVLALAVILLIAGIALANSSDGGSSQSTSRARSSPVTGSSTATQPATGTPAQPATAPVETLSPNQYGIVYIRTASGRTTCMLEPTQVICEATQSNWPTNGVVINADGSGQYKDGNFGDIAPRTISYQEYSAVGWTIAATSAGTRFTNDRTGHGAFVSVEEVRLF